VRVSRDCETGAMPPFGNLYGMPVFGYAIRISSRWEPALNAIFRRRRKTRPNSASEASPIDSAPIAILEFHFDLARCRNDGHRQLSIYLHDDFEQVVRPGMAEFRRKSRSAAGCAIARRGNDG
jgi:hypothetical protein